MKEQLIAGSRLNQMRQASIKKISQFVNRLKREKAKLIRYVRLLFPVPGISGPVSYHDKMFTAFNKKHYEHYRSAGWTATVHIEDSLREVGLDFSKVRACLDFPSGYGRVTRYLRERIPPSRITAGDIDRKAVRFCVSAFGVKPVFSHVDFREIVFPEKYDLIWVGSLLTHLDLEHGITLLEVLAGTLMPGGILIFTTLGKGCVKHLFKFGDEIAAAKKFFEDQLSNIGACYVPYKGRNGYGITLHSTEYIEAFFRRRFAGVLNPVSFKERGWEGQQDIWTYQKKSEIPVP